MFVKLFESILDSSIWFESDKTLRLFIAMLVLAKEDGIVRAATPGLASRANITLAECKAALKVLEGPDLESKNQDYAGARVQRCGGGWLVLNHGYYRGLRTREQMMTAERVRRFRAKEKAKRDDDGDGVTVTGGNVTAASSSSSASDSLDGEEDLKEDGAHPIVEHLDELGKQAWELLAPKMESNAHALACEIQACVDGMRNIKPVPTWPAVSLALSDMAANGDPPRAMLVRRYLQKAAAHLGAVDDGGEGTDFDRLARKLEAEKDGSR